jgi:hypothetical protein
MIESSFILGYCTNVHPGSTWQEVLRNLKQYSLPVREQLPSSFPFGVGAWISSQAAQELLQKGKFLTEFKEFLESSELNLFSLNGFPYGNFHQTSVKYDVYHPDWFQFDRVQYTLNLFEIIRRIARSDTKWSVSTLPISYKSWVTSPSTLETAAHHLGRVALRSYEIEKRDGIQTALCLEPEPLCFLDQSSDVIHFYQEYLLTKAAQHIQTELKISKSDAERIILDKIQICYDTCHADVMFETPAAILKSYDALGIQIGKVQISSALKLDLFQGTLQNGQTPDTVLAPLTDDKYLHQVIGITKQGQKIVWNDLPEAISDWKQQCLSGHFRIHYHVPLFQKHFYGMETTQNHIIELFKLAQSRFITSHWEVETYTWEVLPKTEELSSNISHLITREINWVIQELQKCNLPNSKHSWN